MRMDATAHHNMATWSVQPLPQTIVVLTLLVGRSPNEPKELAGFLDPQGWALGTGGVLTIL